MKGHVDYGLGLCYITPSIALRLLDDLEAYSGCDVYISQSVTHVMNAANVSCCHCLCIRVR